MKTKQITLKKLRTGITVKQIPTNGVVRIEILGPEVIPFRFQLHPAKLESKRSEFYSSEINRLAREEATRIFNQN